MVYKMAVVVVGLMYHGSVCGNSGGGGESNMLW